MAQDGKLRLKILDAQGKPVQGSAQVRLFHQVLSDRRVVMVDASKVNVLTDLYATPQGLYRIEVYVASYEMKNQFVTIAPSGYTDLEVVLRKTGTQGVPPQPPIVTPTPPPAPTLTAKDWLLALYKYSNLTLTELRTQSRELYNHLQGVITDARKAAVLSYFANNSQALREQLQQIDYSPGDRPERSLGQLTLDALTAQQAKPEVSKEASDRIAELEQAGLFTDPARINLTISEHPLFQQDLQHALIYVLANVAKLADAKTEKLIARVGSVAAITDQSLAALIKDGVIDEREAKELGLTAALFRLTDENLALVDALKKSSFLILGGKLSRLHDLVALSTDDWLTIINSAQITPPGGQDRKSYAAALSRLIAALFPTDTLLARLIPKGAVTVTPVLERLKPLLEKNPLVFGFDFDRLHLEGLSMQQIAAGREAHAQLQRLINLQPGLRLDDVLNSSATVADKAKTVASRLGLIDRVARLNPGVNFLALDYSPGSREMTNLKFDGMSQDEQRMVVSNFKIYQRVFSITNDIESAQAVLAAGYRSSANIAGGTFESFQKRTGFGDDTAAAYYVNARDTLATVVATTLTITDIVSGGFNTLFVNNIAPDVNDYLKGLDGYADLFGSQDYCLCKHCQSILSPAAYFVDLMRFVEQYVLENPDYDFTGRRLNHPLNLKVRRNDLWTLPLTCDNTNNLIPYLDIINEILENYISKRRGFAGDLSNRAEVENAVYKKTFSAESSSDPVASFRQPFFLPLERLEAYLSHFNQSRASVARKLSADAAVRTTAALKISKREYDLMAQANTDLTFQRSLYGVEFALAGGKIKSFNAQELLKYTGLTRDDLGMLVKTRFLIGSDIPPVKIRTEKTSDDSVQNDIERVYYLTVAALDRLHRFARLWRRVPWSIPELDLILTQLSAAGSASEINYSVINGVADILALGERWDLPVEQNCALWSTIPRLFAAPDRDPLFDRLFNFRPFVMVDGPLPKDIVTFIHPAFSQSGVPSPPDNTLARLLAGLQLGSDQLAQLIERLAVPLGTKKENGYSFFLTANNLTLLYRHARLAQLLNLSIPDLFQLISFAAIGGYAANLPDLITLLNFHDWWKPSRFTLDDIGFITRGLVQKPENYPDPNDIAAQIIAELKADKSLQFADTIFAFIPGVTEEQSRRIVADNAESFSRSADGTAFTLSDSFDVTKLVVPSSVSVASALAVEDLALKYHISTAVPHRIATHLNISIGKVVMLVIKTETAFAFHASSLVAAIRAGESGPLATLLDTLLRPAILFRDAIFDSPEYNLIHSHGGVFDSNDFNSISVEDVRKVSLYTAIATTGIQSSTAGGDTFPIPRTFGRLSTPSTARTPSTTRTKAPSPVYSARAMPSSPRCCQISLCPATPSRRSRCWAAPSNWPRTSASAARY